MTEVMPDRGGGMAMGRLMSDVMKVEAPRTPPTSPMSDAALDMMYSKK